MRLLKSPVPHGHAFEDDKLVVDAAVAELVEQLVNRYKAIALEQGWTGPRDEDLDENVQAAVDAARAELVLIESRANGEWGVSLGARQDQLREALRLRAARPDPLAAITPGGEAEPVRAWRFDRRRSLTLALAALVIGFATAHPGRTGLFASLACLAALFALGPWGVARRLAAAARAGLRVATNLREIRESRRLDSEIERIEQLIVVAALRKARAETWVAQRLDLVRHQMEIQRARADKAAKIVALRRGNQKGEAERELSIHHSSQRVR